jgi:superfamily II DNA or RNA helicase
MVGIPLTAGVHEAQQRGILIEDRSVTGRTMQPRRMPDPAHPSAPPGQAELFQAAAEAVSGNFAALVQAQTGSGKTVAACHVAGTLRVATLAIVTSRTLAEQWVQAAQQFLGLTPEETGIAQSGVFPPGKLFCAVVVHNIVGEKRVQEWLDGFGFAVWDEAHRMGAREFSRSMRMIRAKYKLALTATPYRKDGCWQLVTDQFGDVAYAAQGDSMETFCYPLESPFSMPPGLLACKPSQWNVYLTRHSGRNRIIVQAAMDLYRRGRRLLLIGDSVRHLHIIHRDMVKAGMDPAAADFYTGYTIPAADIGKNKPRKRQVTPLRHESIRTNKEGRLRVVLGTYAQMKEGVDIPWLDAGIDITPQTDAVQTVGRIRRRKPGKPVPVWLTVVDLNIPPLHRSALKRLSGLREAGVTVQL